MSENWKPRTREEIQRFLSVMSHFPPSPENQSCICFGTTRASELLYRWLSGDLEHLTQEEFNAIIESKRKTAEEFQRMKERLDSLTRGGGWVDAR